MNQAKVYPWIGAVIGCTLGLIVAVIFKGFFENEWTTALNMIALGMIIGLVRGKFALVGVIFAAIYGAIIGAIVGVIYSMAIGGDVIRFAIFDAIIGAIVNVILITICGTVRDIFEGIFYIPIVGAIYGAIAGAILGAILGDTSRAVQNAIEGALPGSIVGAVIGMIDGVIEGSTENKLATGGIVGVVIGALAGVIVISMKYKFIGASITTIPFFITPIFIIIGYVAGMFLGRVAEEKSKNRHGYLQTVPGLFDTAKDLSAKAKRLLEQKEYAEALLAYESAQNTFIKASEGAKALNDTELEKIISNNISALQKNIEVCKNSLGAELAAKAKSKFETGDYTGAIGIYNESLNYFHDPELITKTRSNIESCYIEIDAKNVENLSNQAASLLKEASALYEPFKAREILKQADNIIDEAVTIAKKRNFTEAFARLNEISKNIHFQRGVINEQITSDIGEVDSGTYLVETIASGTSPAIKTRPEKTGDFWSSKHVKILRSYELLPKNNMKFGIRVENNSKFSVMDVQVILDYPKTLFSMHDNVVQSIGNIDPGGKRTAAYILKPLGCIHNEQINALITYKDHTGKKQTLQMRPKEVHCVCPFLKEKPMSEGDYSRLASSSEFVQEGISFKGISVDALAKFLGETCRQMLFKVREYDLEGKKVIYLSGEALGEKAYYLLTAVIQEYKGLTQVVLRAHSDKKYGLNGFLNEMADSVRHLVGSVQNAKEIGIIENTQVINIIDSVVQRTSFGMGEDGSAQVHIKESMMQRSTIGASARKCPNCGREVEANEKFCLECGARL